jgi:hypothetical protein
MGFIPLSQIELRNKRRQNQRQNPVHPANPENRVQDQAISGKKTFRKSQKVFFLMFLNIFLLFFYFFSLTQSAIYKKLLEKMNKNVLRNKNYF